MGISIRDEKGQGVIEYVLLLVAVVSIILGGIYQLNSAFQVWANNYFGNYLTCLLETGELPTLSGSPGDSGLCNELFEPFDIAKGRRLAANAGANAGGGAGSQTAPKPDTGSSEASRSTPVSGSSGGSTNEFRPSGSNSGGGGSRTGTTGRFKPNANTGNVNASDYGSLNGSGNRVTRISLKSRLDTSFAFREEREAEQRSRTVASKKSEEAGRVKKTAIRLKGKGIVKDGEGGDVGFTISGFLRFLIIAAIILALVIFLGGQVLQISKQSDG